MLKKLFIVKIHGNSMLPTFHSGERRLAWRTKKVKVGDVVVLEIPELPFLLIKRIARMEQGKIFVLGDHLNQSIDSRNERIGWLDLTCVVGKVF